MAKVATGEDGFMGDEKQQEIARIYLENDGLSFPEVADKLGVNADTVRRWAKSEGIVPASVNRRVIVKRITVKANTPALQATLDQLFTKTKGDKEAIFDEHLHDVACAIPLLIKQLPAEEWFTKAEKIAKLVGMAREILGKNGTVQNSTRPPVSISILSGGQPTIKELKAQVIELEQDAEAEATG
jgi:transcriptional regulator with XRE-family HTH domain